MALAASAQLSSKDKYNESQINAMLTEVVNTYDLRAVVFATFFRVGFDLHELSSSEKQVMEVL